MPSTPLPDDLDRRILAELGRDARQSFRTLATKLGVSTPTVSQRVKRMEDTGVIRGYRVVTTLPMDAAGPDAAWPCAVCREPIHGPARSRILSGRYYAFCCGTCERSFTGRYIRITT